MVGNIPSRFVPRCCTMDDLNLLVCRAASNDGIKHYYSVKF